MKDHKDQIISFIGIRGPVIPRDISKHLKIDSTFAGAYLSELVFSKKLNVSHAKIGGSPVYYLPEQRQKLEMLHQHLNEKDRIAYGLLKEKTVLRDKVLQPLIRVALRSLKDFSVPLQIRLSATQETETFWKWHLASNEEASRLISQILSSDKITSDSKSPEVQQPRPQVTVQPEPTLKEMQVTLQAEGRLKEEKPKIQEQAKEPKIEEKIKEPGQEEKPKETAREKSKIKKLKAEQKPGQPKNIHLEEIDDSFLQELHAYFKEKSIDVIDFDIKRSNTEIDFTIRVPSVVGSIDYYCKARNKKKCSDGDLSSAFVQGQLKKLPTLFLSPGELTKKAKNMLDNEFKNHLIYKQLENDKNGC